jgi:cation diffusion facilitator family transporter
MGLFCVWGVWRLNVQRRKQGVALVSVGSNAALVAGKLLLGLSLGSVSVLSEAAHSAVDLLAALIAFFAVRTAAKPADEDHPFGHGKWENVSGTIEALLIFLAAAWIAWEAVQKLRHPHPLERPDLGMAMMFVSALVNYFAARLLFSVGRQTESPALEADAWHHLTDVWTSAGVMAGLGIIWLAQRFFHVDLRWLDPLVALGVAVLIARAAWDLTIHSGQDLLDVGLPETERWIRAYLDQQPAPVRGFHHLRTRKSGSTRFVEFHLWVDPDMHVDASHALGDQIVAGIKAEFPTARVIVHVEPYESAEAVSPHEGPEAEPDEEE